MVEEYGEAKELDEVWFGDGTTAYLVRAWKDKIKGINVMKMVLQPYKHMRLKWNLTERDYTDEINQFMEKVYPLMDVTQLSTKPALYLVDCDLFGRDTEVTERFKFFKERIESLQEQNHILIGKIAWLNKELELARADVVKYIRTHMDVIKEVQKGVKVVPIKVGAGATITEGGSVAIEEGT